MSHSVEKHLAVVPSEYDVQIRRFIPRYDEMLAEIAGVLSEHIAPEATVLDVGAGTGRLSAALLDALPAIRTTLVDIDGEMLAVAKSRLERHGARVKLVEATFEGTLPPCDAIAASLSLHHVHAREARVAVLRNLFATLPDGGMLVNADAMVPSSPSSPLRVALMKRWAQHLVTGGDTEDEAYARFESWAKEDRYYSVDEELAMLGEAGFETREVRWRYGPIAVLVGCKPKR